MDRLPPDVNQGHSMQRTLQISLQELKRFLASGLGTHLRLDVRWFAVTHKKFPPDQGVPAYLPTILGMPRAAEPTRYWHEGNHHAAVDGKS